MIQNAYNLCIDSENYQNKLLQSPNRHYSWTHIANRYRMYIKSQNNQNRLVQTPYKHHSWICIEKQYRMHIHISRLPKFLITKQTLQLNLHWKNDTEWIYISVNSHNYQSRLIQLPNRHYSWIHIEKWILDIYNKHPCSAVAIEIYSKQCECVISVIAGNRQETKVAHNCKQM